jgi:hypothetical protein
MERYELSGTWIGAEWREVSKKEWIQAERSAGFRPKMSSDHPDYMNTCATGGFSNGSIRGRIVLS